MTVRVFPKMVTLSQNIAKKILKPGDSAVDATAGNGHDTLFLAELVGSSGRVYSFDIQSEAILNTKRLLLENNVFERVKLLQKGHEEIDSEVTKGIKVVMFNTGYLPGRHNEIITKEKTTLIALKKSLELISVGGLVLLVIYTGHKGGVKEAEAVEKYLNNLSYKHFDVVKINNLNRYNVPPYLICIQKISEKED